MGPVTQQQNVKTFKSIVTTTFVYRPTTVGDITLSHTHKGSTLVQTLKGFTQSTPSTKVETLHYPVFGWRTVADPETVITFPSTIESASTWTGTVGGKLKTDVFPEVALPAATYTLHMGLPGGLHKRVTADPESYTKATETVVTLPLRTEKAVTWSGTFDGHLTTNIIPAATLPTTTMTLHVATEKRDPCPHCHHQETQSANKTLEDVKAPLKNLLKHNATHHNATHEKAHHQEHHHENKHFHHNSSVTATVVRTETRTFSLFGALTTATEVWTMGPHVHGFEARGKMPFRTKESVKSLASGQKHGHSERAAPKNPVGALAGATATVHCGSGAVGNQTVLELGRMARLRVLPRVRWRDVFDAKREFR